MGRSLKLVAGGHLPVESSGKLPKVPAGPDRGEKRGGYSGGLPAEQVGPPPRTRSGSPPAKKSSGRSGQSVKEATVSGSRRAVLVALRARIAATIDDPDTPARDLAALSRRLLDITRELEALDAGSGKDQVSEAAGTPDESWPAG